MLLIINSKDLKKKVCVLNKPELLNLDFEDLQPMLPEEELNLEPEETIPERVKLNPQKRKM